MLSQPAQPPPQLSSYKDFTHWSSAMRAYLIGTFYWPYVEEVGYGKVGAAPAATASEEDKDAYATLKMHFDMNTFTGMEILFRALGEDAAAGYRSLSTMKEVWKKLHDDRQKGTSRKLAEAVLAFTHTPFEEGKELEGVWQDGEGRGAAEQVSWRQHVQCL